MTWVKVCGLTRPIDVEAAEEAGADAVGFVVFPSSPRFVPADMVPRLASAAGDAMTVLVTVDEAPRSLVAKAAAAGVTAVQPHGRHAGAAASAAYTAGFEVLFPRRVTGPVTAADLPAGWTPLFDTPDAELHGGTGRGFDWSLLGGIARPFVLAGGLHPGNVRAAVRGVSPWGVDASSGLESAPGIKDPEKVQRFVAEAKRT